MAIQKLQSKAEPPLKYVSCIIYNIGYIVRTMRNSLCTYDNMPYYKSIPKFSRQCVVLLALSAGFYWRMRVANLSSPVPAGVCLICGASSRCREEITAPDPARLPRTIHHNTHGSSPLQFIALRLTFDSAHKCSAWDINFNSDPIFMGIMRANSPCFVSAHVYFNGKRATV